jgi:hypothetical protein
MKTLGGHRRYPEAKIRQLVDELRVEPTGLSWPTIWSPSVGDNSGALADIDGAVHPPSCSLDDEVDLEAVARGEAAMRLSGPGVGGRGAVPLQHGAGLPAG